MKNALLFSLITLASTSVWAGDIRWEGQYRFEGLRINGPSLADGANSKSYMLHHLTLKPQITAFDGFTIFSRFDVLNNSRFPNDQLGQTFGVGVNPTPGASVAGSPNNLGSGTNSSNSNTIGRQQAAGLLAVNELYANWNHEFGVLTVGRAPIHFGLGIAFNGGFGAFDHWLSNRDLISYRMIMGNISVMPVIAKTYEGLLDQEDDINDFILQLNYENPETELDVGLIYQARRSTSGANSNDTPTAVIGNGSTLSDNYEVDSYNFFVSQWVEKVKVSFELGFMSGNTGLSKNGTEIKHDAMGGAVKLSWLPDTTNWGASFDLGYASGDDPGTENTFEGYIFDRNYDVAFLLFNHPMGSADFFRTAYLRNGATAAPATTLSASESFDSEAISNAVFASGAVHYRWAQKFDFQTRLTFAQLVTDPLQTGVDSNVGYELDLSLKYEPFKGFQWITRTGLFLPGAAFEGGSNSFSTNTAFGFETKAAITF